MIEKNILVNKNLLKVIVILIGLGILTLLGGSLLVYSDQPKFCNKCHIMMPTYANWQASTHSPVKCTDCHAPNSLTDKIRFKAKSAAKDLNYIISGEIPSMIHITSESKEIIFRNCVRCHEQTLMTYHIPVNTYCWNCHPIK